MKRIWTPAWVLFSGGWCFLWMAALQFITEVCQWRRWAFPLVVIGANSIAAYLMSYATVPFIKSCLRNHAGDAFFLLLGSLYQSLLLGASVLLIEWLILLWMYRRKLFLKI